MNILPKHHGSGPKEAWSSMQLHWLIAGPDYTSWFRMDLAILPCIRLMSERYSNTKQ